MPFLSDIDKSFKTGDGGYSGRKLTAFTITVMTVFLHLCFFYHLIKTGEYTLFVEVLITDFIAIAFFQGLVTVQNILELKNGSSKTVIEKSETVIKETEVK